MAIIALYLILPALVIALCLRWRWLDKLGVVIVCYMAGSLLQFALAAMLPASNLQELGALKNQAMMLLLVCAIPLLLMAMDIKAWLRLAPVTLKAMASAVTAVVLAAALALLLFGAHSQYPVETFALTVGVYIGGTPNMAAAKQALQAPEALFLQIHTYDALLSIVYLLFLMTMAQRLFLRLLPAFAGAAEHGHNNVPDDSTRGYLQLLQWRIWRQLWPPLLALLLIIGVVAASVYFMPPQQQTAATMLLLSLAGVVASLHDRVRAAAASYELGMYLVLVFCTLVGSMISVDMLQGFDWQTLGFVATVMFGSLLLHAGFSKLLGIDADTFIITSVATICSPPMVPMIAATLGNRAMLLSGIGAGVIGYALGSVVAISLALLLRGFY